MAKNQVIAGDYQHKKVIGASGTINIIVGFGKIINLNKETIASYEHMSEDHKKSTHVVSIEFKDGKKSLIEIDGGVYKTLLQVMFKDPSETTTVLGQRNTINSATVNKKVGRNGCLIFIVLAVFVFAGTIIAALNMSKNPEKYDTSPKYEMVRVLNITAEQAENVIEVLASVGIEDVGVKHDEMLDNAHFDGEKGYRLSNREMANVILYMDANGAVYNLRYADNELYKEGKVVSKINDYIVTSMEKTQLQSKSEEYLKSILKSPSTAKFPGAQEWAIGKKDGQIIIQSYVDSQNGFGAMIRSEFQFIIVNGNIISLIMDGKEYVKQ